MSKNRKPSSQLRSRSGVGEATQSGCGAEVRRGWAGEGGDQRQLCRRARERRRQATKARVDGGDGLLDLDVGGGRGDFDLDEAELDAGSWRLDAGTRVAGSWSRRKKQGGLKVVATLQPLGIRLGAVQLRSARGANCQLGTQSRCRETMGGAVEAVGARCRPKEWKEETDSVL